MALSVLITASACLRPTGQHTVRLNLVFIYFSDISVEINTFDLKLSLSTKGTLLCCNNNNNNVFVCLFFLIKQHLNFYFIYTIRILSGFIIIYNYLNQKPYQRVLQCSLMHTNLVQVTTSRESQAVRCPGNIFFTHSCCTMKTCDETSQIQIRLTTATRHSGASPKERWKDLPRFCSCSPPSSHGYATTGMDLCCYVGVKYHKVRC